MKRLAQMILMPWTLPCLILGFFVGSVIGFFLAGLRIWNKTAD